MRNIKLLLALFFLISNQVFALRYSFDLIPEKLKVGADAVVRSEQLVLTVLTQGAATEKFKRVVTLLNENASDYRLASVYYNKFMHINYVKAAIYDEKGELVELLNSANIFDMNTSSEGEFYSDVRQKLIVFPLFKYPYTIEYEYEISLNSIITYPTWYFQHSSNVSVEKSSVQYVVPSGVKAKFRDFNLPTKVETNIVGQNTIYTWQVLNLEAFQVCSYELPFDYRAPRLYAAPVNFEYDGYKGSMESWKSFGEWNRKIIDGRDKLSDAEIRKVQNLVKDIPDERNRIKAVYKYLQSKTRYVYIAYGIGGLQPMEANEVEAKGYGDCKALTNYTMALLNAIGVKSNYALVKSGRNGYVNPFFVTNQFDHVILCVPQPSDTVWLECTSQTLPFNYLGDFTSDRYALLVTTDGGKLVKTPGYNKDENIVTQKGVVKISAISNKANVEITSTYAGVFFGRSHNNFANQTEETIKQNLNKSLNFSTFDVERVAYYEISNEKPLAKLNYKLTVDDLFSKSESRIYFTPSIGKEPYIQNSSFEILIDESCVFSDSIVYEIPNGYAIEYMPSDKVVDTAFGKYYYKLKLIGGNIIFQRTFELNKGAYSSRYFSDFRSFINMVAYTDRLRVILKNN